MRAALVAPLAIAASIGAPVASAAATDEPIRLGRSIGPVAVGDGVRAVGATLGRGRLVERASSPFGPVVVRAYPSQGLRVTFTGGRATYVQARFARYRTTRGVRVGAGLAALRRAYPGVARLAPRLWMLGRLRPGGRVTDFRLGGDGRIREIGVGVVLD